MLWWAISPPPWSRKGWVKPPFETHLTNGIWAVREITKSSSTFSATNINSNIVWFLQLHDAIQMESNYTWINYKHDNTATISHIMIYNFVWNLVAFISQKEKNVWFFDYHLLTCSLRKVVLICLMQNIDMCLLYKSHQIARLVSHLINHFPNDCLPCSKIMLLYLVAKIKFNTSFYIIKWLIVAIL